MDPEKAVAVLGTVVFPVVNWKRWEAPWWTRVASRLLRLTVWAEFARCHNCEKMIGSAWRLPH